MLKINSLRPTQKNQNVAKRFYCALLLSMTIAGKTQAKDDLVELDPDTPIIEIILDLLHDLWNFLNGLFL